MEIEKLNTEEIFCCGKCEKEMGKIKVGSGIDMFGFVGTSQVYYCDNKECERYGLLTVVGIKKEK
jgi:hypothetical protein